MKLETHNIKLIFLALLICGVLLLFVFYKQTEHFTQINESDASMTEINIETKKVDKLVVLFSTQYRSWETCSNNHIKLMNHLCSDINNCIIGAHYWNDVDKPPPLDMQKLNIKYSTSDNIANDDSVANIQKWFKRFQYSTKKALDNAEQLYFEKFKIEMPVNQQILRLRPDFIVEDIEKFPLPPVNESNYYISTWNTQHRPNPEINNLEITDIFITDKASLLKILQFDSETLKKKEGAFVEHVFYDMLKELKIQILYDFNIKHGAMRYDKYNIPDYHKFS